MAQGVGVLDPDGFARVERKATVFVVEEQPDFFEGVAIVLRLPPHLLASTGDGEKAPTHSSSRKD